MNIKNVVPKSLKLLLVQGKRYLKDLFTGDIFHFAEPENKDYDFIHYVSMSQPIRVAHLYQNKITNINLAGKKVNEVILEPGEIFSFWKIIGEPIKENGYKKGRNLISGNMAEDYGGGLCQLSGILYHLSLTSGLEILERYNHSVDFYTEENRYTPIGSDATVVYGYKDLRIKNNFTFPVRFSVATTNDQLIANLWGTAQINKSNIVFEKKEANNMIEVTGWNETGKKMNRSVYRKKND